MINMGQFGITVADLKALMELRKEDASKKLIEYGGIDAFCALLKTDPEQGLAGDDIDLELRTQEFGQNYIPKKPPKSFCRLCLEVLKDFMLIILICCAVRFDDLINNAFRLSQSVSPFSFIVRIKITRLWILWLVSLRIRVI